MAKGGKLSKTEVVPVRFDPMVKLAVELAAGLERRPMASMVEYLVAKAMQDWPLVVRNDQPVTALEVARECWNSEQSTRLMILARDFPELLSFDERRICDSARLALQFDSPHQVSPVFETVLIEAVWPFVLQHAEGKLDTPRLWLECRKAAALLIQDSGGTVANLLRGLALGELMPQDFAVRLTADPSTREQLLNILGTS